MFDLKPLWIVSYMQRDSTLFFCSGNVSCLLSLRDFRVFGVFDGSQTHIDHIGVRFSKAKMRGCVSRREQTSQIFRSGFSAETNTSCYIITLNDMKVTSHLNSAVNERDHM